VARRPGVRPGAAALTWRPSCGSGCVRRCRRPRHLTASRPRQARYCSPV
jgi:hypothetical protein